MMRLLIGVSLIFLCAQAFAFEMRFTPNFTVSGEYTDNVFLSEDNEEDDYIVTVSPGGELECLWRYGGLQASYNPAYVKYRDFDENDTWRHEAQLYNWNDIARNTRLEFFNNFLRTEDPLGEEDILIEGRAVVEADTTGRTDRRKYYRNEARLRLEHQFGANDTIFTELEYGLLRNDDRDVQDNDRYAASTGVNYWFTNKVGSELAFTFTKGEFDDPTEETETVTEDFYDYDGVVRIINRISRRLRIFGQYNHIYRDFDGEIDDDYQIYAPSANLDYQIAERLDLVFGVGYFYQQVDGDDDEQGPFINADLTKTWRLTRSTIQAIGSSGIQRQEFGAENIGLQRFVSLTTSADYRFTRRLTGDVIGRIIYSDEIGDNNAQDAESIEQYRYLFGAGLELELTRWMVAELEYTYNKFDSTDNTDDYTENRVYLGVTLRPDQPWRLLY